MYGYTSLFRTPVPVTCFPAIRLTACASHPRTWHQSVMFSKAIRDHTNTTKPLQPNQARLNAAQPIATNQAAGAKRKFEMARPQQTPLATLHSAVYFDENDFEDDEDIDLEGSIGVPAPLEDLKPMPTTTKPEIKYPALPPVPDISRATPQEPGPSSSVPLPWSSSPPTHFAPPQPPKRRTLPWEGKETKPETKPETKLTRTPSNKKQTLPWNTSMSALKESQKELRKQQKTRIAQEKKDIQVGQIAPKVPSIFLSEEQKRVVEAIVNDGKSIFFTGSAGTGKSVLMREIIRRLREKYKREPDRVAVTASTGLAACNIEGVTLHSFAGVGLGKEGVADLVKKVKRNQKAKTRWMRTKILIIDEVSMVDGEFFDKLEELARKIRSNGRPFGGIQLVVTGDFFQLPPVPDSSREAKFAFAAATWNTSIQHTILLTHVFRQKDPAFAAMLNEMRLGNLSPPTINAFKALARPLNFDDSLEATELFPTRTEVENANSVRMNRLSGENMTFTAIDSGTIQDVQQRERLLANCMAPPVIHLKKGAQVMLIKNMDETLVNGSLGKVIAFMDEIRFDFHTKSDDNLQDGSGYLSDDDPSVRARKKLKGMSYDPNGGGVNTGRKWPVVCFTLPDGTERHLLCQPEAWKIELPNGEVQAQRQQVPLILAWALSIHKAQGQTLQRVKVDLGRVFEKGQAYVALSRATSQEGLQVSRFDPKKVMVHPKVIDFYANLSTIQDVRRSDAVVDIRAPKGGRSDAKYQQDDDDYEAAILQSLA